MFFLLLALAAVAVVAGRPYDGRAAGSIIYYYIIIYNGGGAKPANPLVYWACGLLVATSPYIFLGYSVYISRVFRICFSGIPYMFLGYPSSLSRALGFLGKRDFKPYCGLSGASHLAVVM